MAEFKYTAQRGKNSRGNIAVAVGATEAQTDTISVNIDRTNLSKGDALVLVDAIKAKIIAEPWPPIS